MEEEYYYLTPDNQRVGPFTLNDLICQSINAQTLIWRNGLLQWTSARQVPEVAALLANTPPPIPSESTGEGPRCCPPYGDQTSRNNLPECPETYLVWSILATVLCCLPFGIVAVYESTQVEKYYYRQDYVNAEKASKRARNWCWASLLSVVLIVAVYCGLIMTGAILAAL